MEKELNFIAPLCTCCAESTPLLPRDDLPGGLAACGVTGQLYRPQGTSYVPTTLPNLAPRRHPDTGVRIDLSRGGYA